MPLISICIPAYKRINYLKRLLDSIIAQTFKDFEVVITDDSPDNSLEEFLKPYLDQLPIIYHQNKPAKGTPANWNIAIAKASGQWIKIMHDDDWFTSTDSLGIFAKHTYQNKYFIFSAYANSKGINSPSEIKRLKSSWGTRIIKEPMTLLAHNVIGPPSVTLIHSSSFKIYDERLKWRVDMDYYVSLLLKENDFEYIDEVLVNVGISDSQVTNYCFQNPGVELPEGFVLLQKYGAARLANIWVYDAWWRLLRNMQMDSMEKITQFEQGPWPKVIQMMVHHLKMAPSFLLKIGLFSKLMMAVSYIFNQLKASS